MPAQNRVRREQCAEFFESLATEDLGFDSETTPLVVAEQDPLLAKFLFEDLVFRSQVFDHFLLLAIDPTGEDGESELPGLENESHDRSPIVKCAEMAFTIG